MEFWLNIVGLLRRKGVLIPLVLVALNVGVGVFLFTPATYTSDTTQVLTMTQYGGTESRDPVSPTELSNPLLNFNESLRTTSAIIIQSMNSKSVATELGATGSTTIVVNDGRTNPDLLGLNGPFLYIAVKSKSADEADRVVVEAQALMRQKLLEWQQALNAPTKTFVQLAVVVPPRAPEQDRSRATRLALVAFFATFLLGLAIVYLSGQRTARRRAREAAAHVEDEAPKPADWPDKDSPDADDGEDFDEEADEAPFRRRSQSGTTGYAQLALIPAPVKLRGRPRRR